MIDLGNFFHFFTKSLRPLLFITSKNFKAAKYSNLGPGRISVQNRLAGVIGFLKSKNFFQLKSDLLILSPIDGGLQLKLKFFSKNEGLRNYPKGLTLGFFVYIWGLPSAKVRKNRSFLWWFLQRKIPHFSYYILDQNFKCTIH